MNILDVMNSVALAQGKKIVAQLTAKEVEAFTNSFRADGWKTVITFQNYAGTSITHTSIKEGEDLAIEHEIELQGYSCSETEEEGVLCKVTLRFVDRKDVEKYIRDWTKHCNSYPKKGLQRGESFLMDMVLDITDRMQAEERWKARMGVLPKEQAECKRDEYIQGRKELEDMFNR